MLLIVLKLPYYASIMLDALELYYAQNYAGIIRQGLTVYCVSCMIVACLRKLQLLAQYLARSKK